jgi:glycosyltransferase involved in cell wall biosynthesis
MRGKWLLVIGGTHVSVIVPTWNEENYLERCLKSLMQQSLNGSFDVIVVDGGSTDRTLDIAHKFAHEVLVVPGKPVGAARNIGALKAKGDVLAFIDADTVASKNWLEKTVESFDSEPAAVCVTGPTLPYEGSRFDELMYKAATGWAQRVSLTLGFPHVAGFNCAYRKDAFWHAGGFDERRELSEDVALSLRIRNQGPILFNEEMIAYTSLRRIKQCGYPYLTIYYTLNAVTLLLFGRTMAYPKIR